MSSLLVVAIDARRSTLPSPSSLAQAYGRSSKQPRSCLSHLLPARCLIECSSGEKMFEVAKGWRCLLTTATTARISVTSANLPGFRQRKGAVKGCNRAQQSDIYDP